MFKSLGRYIQHAVAMVFAAAAASATTKFKFLLVTTALALPGGIHPDQHNISILKQMKSWSFAGHPDFHVHSGESAIIVPKAVTGLGRRQVAVVAVAKHHTAVATTSCELFTWGSNRDGRLGYAAVDTQPTPRK